MVEESAAASSPPGLPTADEICIHVDFENFGRGGDVSIAPLVLIDQSPVIVLVASMSFEFEN